MVVAVAAADCDGARQHENECDECRLRSEPRRQKHAHPPIVWHVLLAEMQVSPHGMPVVQCLQHGSPPPLPLDGVNVGCGPGKHIESVN